MTKIVRGRYTANVENEFVIFLVGIRINKTWAIHQWLPPLVKLFLISKHLKADRSMGLLATKSWFRWREILFVQYWTSMTDLKKFAHTNDGIHIQAWRDYNLKYNEEAALGIWHETYQIRGNECEFVYTNMPNTGLAKAIKNIE